MEAIPRKFFIPGVDRVEENVVVLVGPFVAGRIAHHEDVVVGIFALGEVGDVLGLQTKAIKSVTILI